MFTVNTYFEGKVMSLSFQPDTERATVGVIAAGEYTFGTDSIETMTIICGRLEARLPGEEQWQSYGPGQSFVVGAGQQFSVRTGSDTSYLCRYSS